MCDVVEQQQRDGVGWESSCSERCKPTPQKPGHNGVLFKVYVEHHGVLLNRCKGGEPVKHGKC
jgi:hypothetical protein